MEPLRIFSVHHTNQGMVSLQEHRKEDDVVLGVPIALPVGTSLKDNKGVSWVVLRQLGKSLIFNRPGAKTGMRFFLYPRKVDGLNRPTSIDPLESRKDLPDEGPSAGAEGGDHRGLKAEPVRKRRKKASRRIQKAKGPAGQPSKRKS